MSAETNAQLARRWFEEVWNGRRDATVLELMHPNVVGVMEGGEVRSPQDFLDARKALLGGFPDLRVEVEDVVAQGDNAVVRWSAQGTHDGEGLGIAPSRKAVSFRGMSWMVFSNGRIVRGWDAWNQGRLVSEITVPAELAPPESRNRI